MRNLDPSEESIRWYRGRGIGHYRVCYREIPLYRSLRMQASCRMLHVWEEARWQARSNPYMDHHRALTLLRYESSNCSDSPFRQLGPNFHSPKPHTDTLTHRNPCTLHRIDNIPSRTRPGTPIKPRISTMIPRLIPIQIHCVSIHYIGFADVFGCECWVEIEDSVTGVGVGTVISVPFEFPVTAAGHSDIVFPSFLGEGREVVLEFQAEVVRVFGWAAGRHCGGVWAEGGGSWDRRGQWSAGRRWHSRSSRRDSAGRDCRGLGCRCRRTAGRSLAKFPVHAVIYQKSRDDVISTNFPFLATTLTPYSHSAGLKQATPQLANPTGHPPCCGFGFGKARTRLPVNTVATSTLKVAIFQ